MTAEVAVVGAGQLGSRHLQALARLSRPARVWVSDPNPASLALARERWNEASPPASLVADFSGRLPERLDAAIVATDAASRERAIENLLKDRKVRFLVLEKVLFQDPDSLARVGALLERGGVRAWVNCPRRLWPLYRDRPRPKLPLELRVSGSGWGLATNAVHYLDLAAFLGGCRDFAIDTTGLSREESPSKRPGFVEFFGTLVARADGQRVVLTCERGEKRSTVEIDGAVQDEAGSPVQSRLTTGVIEDLLARGDCGLTPYAESARIHRPYLEALREHWRSIKDVMAPACPIT